MLMLLTSNWSQNFHDVRDVLMWYTGTLSSITIKLTLLWALQCCLKSVIFPLRIYKEQYLCMMSMCNIGGFICDTVYNTVYLQHLRATMFICNIDVCLCTTFMCHIYEQPSLCATYMSNPVYVEQCVTLLTKNMPVCDMHHSLFAKLFVWVTLGALLPMSDVCATLSACNIVCERLFICTIVCVPLFVYNWLWATLSVCEVIYEWHCVIVWFWLRECHMFICEGRGMRG